MKIIRLAAPTLNQLDKRTDKLDRKVRDSEKEIKDVKSNLAKLFKTIDSLNIGQRRFWQAQTVFTSLQRKIERFERVELEWRNYKKTLEDDMKKLIEKRVKAQVKLLGTPG